MGKKKSARWAGCVAIVFLGLLFCRRADGSDEYFTPYNPPKVTGQYVPELAALDRLMTDFLIRNDVPGASVAMARNGVIIYARGFGWADMEAHQAVQPQSLFRICSISKPFTATAVLKLVARGQLSLDAKAFDVLGQDVKPLPGKTLNPQLRQITILELLQHRGGWERNELRDPMLDPVTIARAAHVPSPPDQRTIIDYMLSQPLEFAPGTKFSYCNFGYCVLGRVIEKVSGQKYEDFVRANVFKPIGITDMVQGHSFLKDRLPGEARYYDVLHRNVRSVFQENLGQTVPRAYGGFNMEALDSVGAWLASAVDLVKLASAFDDLDRSPLLDPQMAHIMFDRPAGVADENGGGADAGVYYGCGWRIRTLRRAGAFNAWHDGLLHNSSSTTVVRRFDGVDFAVLFNSGQNGEDKILAAVCEPQIEQLINRTKQWPTQGVAIPGN
jgi:CubicO group peptidase (beta-lactamase class C family)